MQISPQLAFETKLSDTIPQASNPLHTGNLTGGKHLYLKFSALFIQKSFLTAPNVRMWKSISKELVLQKSPC